MTSDAPQPRLPITALIAASLFFNGTGYAATLPYTGIVAIEGLGFSNADYALVLSAGSVAGVLASVSLGYMSDRIGDRRMLVLFAALMGAIGYGLVYALRSPLAFVAANCVIIPFGGALFSQCFGYARAYQDARNPGRAEFTITILRTVFSASWVLMPPVAGWVAATYQVFDVYGLAAVAYLGSGLAFVILLFDPAARVGKAETRTASTAGGSIAKAVLVGIGGIVLINVALRLNGTAAPLAIVTDFGGTLADVGTCAALAAFLEIPFTLAWGVATRRWKKHVLITCSALVYTLYLFLLTQAQTVTDVLWLQIFNGVAVAGLMSIPISYMQEAIRGQVGLSTSLLDVVFVLSGLLSAALFGLLATSTGYVALFWISGVLSLIGALVLMLAHRVFEPRLAAAG